MRKAYPITIMNIRVTNVFIVIIAKIEKVIVQCAHQSKIKNFIPIMLSLNSKKLLDKFKLGI